MSYKFRLLIPFIFIILFWVGVIYKVLVAFLPHNPMSPTTNDKMNISSFVVEGWSFFTRDAREPNLFVYAETDHEIVKVETRNSSNSNFFGLSRGARVLSIEIGGLLSSVDTSSWVKVDRSNVKKGAMFENLKTVNVVNKCSTPILKGTVYLELREKVPWAWIANYDKIEMPSKIIKLHVQ